MKLPSYTFYGENVVVLTKNFAACFAVCFFSLPFIFTSLSFASLLSRLSVVFSIFLFSMFQNCQNCGLDNKFSLILQTTHKDIETISAFELSLLHKTRLAIQFPPKNLELHLGCHTVDWVILLWWYACGADGRTGWRSEKRSRDYKSLSISLGCRAPLFLIVCENQPW